MMLPPGYLAVRIRINGEGDAFIFPVIKVGAAVAVDANLGRITAPAGNFMFAKPVPGVMILEEATTMGVDMNAIVIRPVLIRQERMTILSK